MKRVIWHWTAGSPGMVGVEADSYHEIIQPDGTVQPGTWPIEANRAPIRGGRYAAHTLNTNGDSIGLACDAMSGARERPLSWGSNPLTPRQIEAMLVRTAHWCRFYDIPVGRETTLSHAEVQPTLGIRQRSKWDISVLPGMARVIDPVTVGDELRRRLRVILQERPAVPRDPIEPPVPETDRVIVRTAGSPLNLRRWPSLSPNILGTIPNNTILPVQRRGVFEGRAWVCVGYRGLEGWIVADLTRDVSAAA